MKIRKSDYVEGVWNADENARWCQDARLGLHTYVHPYSGPSTPTSPAVAINEKLRSLPQAKIEGENYAPKVSVGINDGKVVYGPIGAAAAHRLDFTVIGDTVNLAARVESIAEADQIVLRSDLADRLSSQYAFEQLGKRKIKGKDHPVELSSFVVT